MKGNLDQLNDIITPEPISFWPLAEGWYVLFLIIISFLIPLAIWKYRAYQSNQYRRCALSEVEEINQISDQQLKLKKLFVLLKRTALTAYPRHQVAALSGEQWWHFLTQNSGIKFQESTIEACHQVLYNPGYKPDKPICEKFNQEVKAWIKKHRSHTND